jgi:hypothetical protein
LSSAGTREGLALLLLAASPLLAGRVDAQPAPAPVALPSVVYPTRDPDTGRAADSVPLQTPAAALPVVVQGPPIQYVLVDGVWGYRDRFHRFHPRPVSVASDPDDRPSNAAPPHGARPPATVRPGSPAQHYATRLPNPPPGGIVAVPSSPREHTTGH